MRVRAVPPGECGAPADVRQLGISFAVRFVLYLRFASTLTLPSGSDLSNWLDSDPPKTSACPVCKSQIKDIQQDVFPIYSGSGNGKKQVDPRTKPRPKPSVTPAPQAAPQQRGTGLFGTPLFDSGGWTVQAGVFPFPGLSMGWSNQNAARLHATRFGLDPMQSMQDMTPEQRAAATEQARIQQRNALIAFVVMIVLFSLSKSTALVRTILLIMPYSGDYRRHGV